MQRIMGIRIMVRLIVGIISFLNDPSEANTSLFQWNYHDKGPHVWSKLVDACSGAEQSPVNIAPKDIEVDAKLQDFHFSHTYEQDVRNVLVTNDGNGIKFHIDQMEPLVITGGGLPAEYSLLQFHFHWGFDSNEGSEHTINGRQYPLELHLVHLLHNGTSNITHSAAVLGILFDLSERDNPWIENAVGSIFHEVTHKDESYNIPTVRRMMDILPANKSNFFRYRGSLTTPTCQEIVIWTVFAETQPISKKQLSYFRTFMETNISATSHRPLANNFRPVQPLNNRKIYCRFHPNLPVESTATASTKPTTGHAHGSAAQFKCGILLIFYCSIIFSSFSWNIGMTWPI